MRSNILIVEDCRELAEFTKKFMEEHGMLATISFTAKEALTLIKLNPTKFTHLIVDIELPDMYGDDFIRKVLYHNKSLSNSIIVFSGGGARNPVIKSSLRFKNIKYVEKPHFEGLIDKLEVRKI